MALVSNKTAIPYVQKAPTSIGNSPYNGLDYKSGPLYKIWARLCEVSEMSLPRKFL